MDSFPLLYENRDSVYPPPRYGFSIFLADFPLAVSIELPNVESFNVMEVCVAPSLSPIDFYGVYRFL